MFFTYNQTVRNFVLTVFAAQKARTCQKKMSFLIWLTVYAELGGYCSWMHTTSRKGIPTQSEIVLY